MSSDNGDPQNILAGVHGMTTVLDVTNSAEATQLLPTCTDRLAVIVPVYNEERTVAELLRRLEAQSCVSQIIIVDDGSTDRTWDELESWRSRASFQATAQELDGDSLSVIVVQHDKNRGKGGAIRTGLEHVACSHLIIQDADLEYDPADILRMWQLMHSARADVVFGSRYLERPGLQKGRFVLQSGVRFLNLLVRLLFRVSVTDEATCYKMFKVNDLNRMNLVCERFEFCPEVTAKSCALGLKIAECQISYSSRTSAEGKKLQAADALAAVQTLFRFATWRPLTASHEAGRSRGGTWRFVLMVAACVVIFAAGIGWYSVRGLSGGIADIQIESATAVPLIENQNDIQSLLRSRVAPVSSVSRESVTLAVQFAIGKRMESVGDVLHLLHFRSRDFELQCSSGARAGVIDTLLNCAKARDYFSDGVTVSRTQWGIRFPKASSWHLANSQRNVEAHPGQALATLGSQGVSLGTSVVLDDGSLGTVQEILNDLRANFLLEGEIYWDVVALSLYVAPQREWNDKFGRVVSFDAIAGELCNRTPELSQCAGTHTLIALTILLNVDTRTQVLSPGVRLAVQQYLKATVAQLESSMLSGGGWDFTWMKGRQQNYVSDPASLILVTGHHLEWLLILPHEIQPQREVYERSAVALSQELLRFKDDPGWRDANYCPLVHAVRSLAIVTGNEDSLVEVPNLLVSVPGNQL